MKEDEQNSDLLKVYGSKNLVQLESVVGTWIGNNVDSRVRSTKLKSLGDCSMPADILNFAVTLGMSMDDFEAGFTKRDKLVQKQWEEKKGN